MQRHKLLVISLDAMIEEDFDVVKDKPAFKWLLENGSKVASLRSIYPSYTYPCHVTMLTGCYPDKHGVNNNYSFSREDFRSYGTKWNYFHDIVLTKDLFDACKEKGLSTASISWPVTGNHPNVDYLLDEIWIDKKDGGETKEEWKQLYLNSGTSESLFSEVIEPFVSLRMLRAQPQTSYYSTNVACEIIRRYKPDVMFVHLTNIDSIRHANGVFSKAAFDTLSDSEKMLEMFFDTLRKNDIFDETNIIITSDHGHIDEARIIHINQLLADKGLIELDKEGNMLDWKALATPTGMSAQVFLKDPNDKDLYELVFKVLKEIAQAEVYGISEVYTKEEVKKAEHLDGQFSFVIESDGFTKFIFNCNNCYCQNHPIKVADGGRSNHGFHPDKGPKPVFLACGPDIKKQETVLQANLVDGAPTYAKLLGVNLPNTDGRVLSEILKC